MSIPGIPASLINLSFALFPGDPWYEAHPDNAGALNDLGRRICTKGEIDKLRLETERHEGITQGDNSHYGIDQGLLRKWKLGACMGSHVIGLNGSDDEIPKQMARDFKREWEREDAVLGPMQDNFDSVDRPAIVARLGCSIFLKD